MTKNAALKSQAWWRPGSDTLGILELHIYVKSDCGSKRTSLLSQLILKHRCLSFCQIPDEEINLEGIRSEIMKGATPQFGIAPIIKTLTLRDHYP